MEAGGGSWREGGGRGREVRGSRGSACEIIGFGLLAGCSKRRHTRRDAFIKEPLRIKHIRIRKYSRLWQVAKVQTTTSNPSGICSASILAPPEQTSRQRAPGAGGASPIASSRQARR